MSAKEETAARYRKQQAEWSEIRQELIAKRSEGARVKAIEVTTEQKKRMALRGETRITLQEIVDAYSEGTDK